MPFYRALVRPGLLSEAARERFAQDVVDIHCGATGAPPSFVHVLVSEEDRDQLPSGCNARAAGTIRAGRTDDQKAEMIEGLSRALARRAGVGRDTVSTALRDIEASYTMEGGALLPEPGSAEEDAWKSLGEVPAACEPASSDGHQRSPVRG